MKKIVYTIATIIFIQCANPVGPTGGDKDITPPVLLKTKIESENSTKKITLIFDENINTKGSIILSPITNKKNIEINKHRNTIWFNVPKETNSISLSDIISDVNENNPGRYKSIILGNDSLKYVFNFKSFNPTKDKIKSYALIDSFMYYGDNSRKGKIEIEGLKNQTQFIYTFNDLNNNDRYDNNEDQYIQLIQGNQLAQIRDSIKDTSTIYIYPPKLKEIKKYHLQKEGVSIYTQVPKFFIQSEKIKQQLYFLEHLDSMIIHTSDTSYLENALQNNYQDVKFIEAKIDIKPSKKYDIKIGQFEKDTLIQFEFNLGLYIEKIQKGEITLKNKKELEIIKNIKGPNTDIYKGSEIELFEKSIKNPTFINLWNTTKRDSVIKKIKIKLGKTTIKNNNKNKNLKIKFYNEGKTIAVEHLKEGNNDYYLPTGNYKYSIWQDINNNGEIDTENDLNECIHKREKILYESIIEYLKETSVNSKLDNIIIVE